MTLLEEGIRLIGGRVGVCFLAADPENAREIWEAGRGAAIPTIEAHALPDEAAVARRVRELMAVVPAVSVALGGGADPTQWEKVLAGGRAGAAHLNQPFSTAGYCKGAAPRSWVNGVVAPGGRPGHVLLETLAGRGPAMDVSDAARLLKEAGVDALKFHPAKGIDLIEETVAACAAAKSAGLTGFEPAGGVSPENLPALARACLETGIPVFLPHVFGAVIDRSTGRTKPEAVQSIVTTLEGLLG